MPVQNQKPLADKDSQIPKIIGFLRTVGMSFTDGDSKKNYISFPSTSMAIVGKNGSGKSTLLTELALTARPWAARYVSSETESIFDLNHGAYEADPRKIPFWRAGFVVENPLHFIGKTLVRHGLSQINLNHPDNSEREILPLCYLPPASAFVTQMNKNDISIGAPHYYREFDSYQNEMFKHANICIFPVRVENRSSENGSRDLPFEAGWVSARILFHNEDTPTANVMKNKLKERLLRLTKSDSEISYKEFLMALSKHETENLPEPGVLWSIESFPILDNPLFTPWSLGGQLIWSCNDDENVHHEIEAISHDLEQISIEKPKHHIDIDAELPIVMAVDSSLLNISEYNDVDQIIFGNPIPQKRGGLRTQQYGKMEVLQEWKNLESRVMEILSEWNILWTWDRKWGSKPFVSLNTDSNYFQDASGKFNAIARIWIHRAWQIAKIEKIDTPYKIAIWDEPEIGLHPSAIDVIAKQVIPFINSLGIQLIYATHSMRLAIASNQINSCERDKHGDPQLKPWKGIPRETAIAMGFTKINLLESIKRLIIVEGEMDRLVLNTLYEMDLEINRTQIVTLAGTNNLMSVADAEIILHSLDSKILIVLDGLDRSSLSAEILKKLNADCKSGDWIKVKLHLSEIRRSVLIPKSEGRSLIDLINLIADKGDRELIQRFEFFMFQTFDIVNVLPIDNVLGHKSRFISWSEVHNSMKLKGLPITSSSQKSFLYDEKTPLDKSAFVRGVAALLDKPLEGDFLALHKMAFPKE